MRVGTGPGQQTASEGRDSNSSFYFTLLRQNKLCPAMTGSYKEAADEHMLSILDLNAV